ncbi:ABC transporter permease [Nonomuraea mesophila]|uniref:ABC transporter permease n=1 Tax=Nonomuraea mesophila TaxID=2530382 RepID=A0A4R5E8A6_9ACTN|nr:ABC transporter permease [Nonomuraea mesophila]TDE27319.1 ABC transporter permease [Nonomuraea mesophila]
MSALVLAEWHRLTSARLWRWAVLAAIGSGAFTALLAFIGPENFDPPLPGLHTAEGTRVVLGMLGLLAFVPALLGTSAVAAEHRHRTITTTLLYAPRRWTALLAKIVTFTAAGLAYGAITAVVAGAGLFTAAAAKGFTLGLPPGEVLALLARIAVTMGVYTLLGVGFGALFRNQVAALVVLGSYFYVLETALMLVPGIKALYPYLPGGATAALTGFTYLADAVAAQTGQAAGTLLPASLGGAVLVGYAALAALAAVAAPLRRDIT